MIGPVHPHAGDCRPWRATYASKPVVSTAATRASQDDGFSKAISTHTSAVETAAVYSVRYHNDGVAEIRRLCVGHGRHR